MLSMHPYNAITLRMPGRHALDTTPVGGDFVVCVDDAKMGWVSHQFTHTDIFNDLELKTGNEELAKAVAQKYLEVLTKGLDPDQYTVPDDFEYVGIHPKTFLYAVQCLAVAEHRRYSKYEAQYGGRYLPFRFGAGIVEGRWTAGQASERQRRGRPGVEWLERDHGVPTLTKELMA